MATTSLIARAAHACGIPVEAELGQVLQSRDQVSAQQVSSNMTDPDLAGRFVRLTGCDTLAIAVGSVHAMQSQAAELDQDRIRACAAAVSVPLVLHGSSGVTEDSIRQAIVNGVAKINVGTYITAGFCEALRQASAERPSEHDTRKVLGPARDEVRRRVQEKIRLFRSSGQATPADAALSGDLAGSGFAAVSNRPIRPHQLTGGSFMNVGVLTGGGDVPGLNPAIRGVARRCFQHGYTVTGILDGWRGLVDADVVPLDQERVSGILHVGGTILGSSRTNPFKKEVELKKALENVGKLGLDAIVAIGGDDTMSVAMRLHAEHGVPCVGVPKTMDNDVGETEFCIGFDTSVSIVAEAIDRLHTTACSHHRVLVVEVMGRHAGWVAVYGGMAGGADYIAIPELPVDLQDVVANLKRRYELGKCFSVIVVAEGAEIEGMKQVEERDPFGHVISGQASRRAGAGGATGSRHRLRSPGSATRAPAARRLSLCLRPGVGPPARRPGRRPGQRGQVRLHARLQVLSDRGRAPGRCPARQSYRGHGPARGG